MSSTVRQLNGEASPVVPLKAHALDSSASMSWPMVMRDGMACGFMMMEGMIPEDVNGMSSSRYIMPIVPF